MNSNFFSISVDKVHVFQYDLDIVPVPRNSPDCRKFLEISLAHAKVEHSRFLYDIPTDDKEPIKTFFSRTKLEGIENPFSFIDNNKKTGVSKEYTIRVRQTRELIGKDCGPQIVSIILNDSIQKLNYVCLKSGFFNMENIKRVERTPVRLARGFSFSVNKSDKDSLYTLCIKPEFLTLQSETVADRINQMMRNGKSQEEISDLLRNKNIFVPHSNRFYKIMKLDFSTKPSDSFAEGTEYKSTIDYFQKKYPRMGNTFRNIRDGDVFNDMKGDNCMVVSMIPMKQRNTRMVRHNVTTLPPSICLMGGQPELRPLDQANVTQSRQLTPRETVSEVKNIIGKIAGLGAGPNASDYEVKRSNEIKEILSNWGVSISTEPIVVKHQKLSMPLIRTGSGTENPDPLNGSFRRGLRGKPFRTPNSTDPFENWVLICNDRDKDKFWSRDSMRILDTMELKYSNPILCTTRYINGTEVQREIDNLKRSGRMRAKPSIIIIGLANNDAKTYKDVKRVCAKENLVSQCVNMANLNKAIMNRRADSYLWGLFQQIVSKVGGVIWSVDIAIPKVTSVPTMICGIHYVPPSATSTIQGGSMQFSDRGTGEGQLAYLSMCCTYDQTFVRHYNQCRGIDPKRVTRGGQGINVEREIGDMMSRAVEFFSNSNKGHTPARVIVLRSGLPEGEVSETIKNEIAAIKGGIESFFKRKDGQQDKASHNLPKLTMIVAKRRCSARFVDNTENAVPGTYIDDGRLLVAGRDFYMISGFTPKRGPKEAPCSKPVFYSVRLNESEDIPISDIMRLIFYTSFNYVNYPGPQSLPTTLRYAVSMAQHVSEKTGYAPQAELSKGGLSSSPFFI